MDDAVRESDALHARVRRMAAGADEPFDALARDVVSFQLRRVRPFARLARGHEDADLARLPGVPTDVFRLTRVSAHPSELDGMVFRTSGTSTGARGEHAFRTLETYRAVSLAWAERLLFPDATRMDVVLLSDPAARDSSLGFMMELLGERLGGRVVRALLRSDHGALSFDLDGLRSLGDLPVVVLGASFAFVHLLDRLGGERMALPEGSRVMQTGGFKGRSREVAADALRLGIARTFGVPEHAVVSEYGMTELTSQGWEPCLARALGRWGAPSERGAHALPPWMRAFAVDPVSFDPRSSGETGLLKLVDLANVDSAAIVQTSDLGVVSEAGVRVIGRLPGATARGCSIAMDEALSP